MHTVGNQSLRKFIAIFAMVMVLFTSIITDLNSPTNITASAASTEPVIATLTIFSDISDGSDLGTHSFLYIYNKSSSSIYILGYRLGPAKGMTIGTYGNRDNGKGIYVNEEAYMINTFGSYSSRISLTTNLNNTKIQTLNAKMKKCNTWSYTKNCAWFAKTCWNSVSPKAKKLSVTGVATPRALYTKISNNNTNTKNKKIVNCISSRANVYRYNSNGELVVYGQKNNKSSSSKSSSF